jgi:hypothetical protein
MYRVTTHTGIVDVTEDHSLLDENKKIVRPTDTIIGMKLLHAYPEHSDISNNVSNNKKKITLDVILDYIKNIHLKNISEKRAFIYGFFYGDGSCGHYHCPSGKKHSWCLNQQNMEFCIVLKSLCEEVYECKFKIVDTLKSSGVYKIVPVGSIKKFVELYREVSYNKDKYKKVAPEFLNAEYDIRFAYCAGYYAADGAKCHNQTAKNIMMSNNGKIGTAGLYYMFNSLGLNVSINTRTDKMDIFKISATSNQFRKHPNTLKKMEFIGMLEKDEYVYDIETEEGNFNCGFPLIVKNTDSVFFKFNLKTMSGAPIIGKEALKMTIELAQEAGKMATMFLKKPHDLEYEKTFLNFCLLSKKRYVGILYEFDPDKGKLKSMGLVLKRRDNANIVKDIYGEVIDILMNGGNVRKSISFVRASLENIIQGNYPMEKLIVTKSLRSNYKNPQQIGHKVLADRMGERDPGNKPKSGDRIAYVFIENPNKKALQGDRIESPAYILENEHVKINYAHYITNQIMKPLQQLFALVLDDMKEFRDKYGSTLHKWHKELEKLKERWPEDEKYRKKLDELRAKKIKEIIFDEYLERLK